MNKFLILGTIILLIAAATSPKSMRTLGRAVRLAFMGNSPDRTPATAAGLELSYRILGVAPSASWDEIVKAYRRKAKVHHPDRGGDEDAMRALNEAFSLLKRARGGQR
jgi:DnaJ-class molecular chaperone